MNTINLSQAYIQDQKHAEKSEKFQVIQPSKIGEVLADHGFDLVHLKTGKAKDATKQAFQTTVARYRSRETFEIEGLSMDLIFKVPHLYGALTGVLGLFRGVCANQLNVGTHFETVKVSHVKDPMNELDRLIPILVAQREKLVETVKIMQSRDVTPVELTELARSMALTRLDGIEGVDQLNFSDLLIPRRSEDLKEDLFTVFNVIQENLMRHGLTYSTKKETVEGVQTRNYKSRKINEAGAKAIDFNGTIFDQAMKLVV